MRRCTICPKVLAQSSAIRCRCGLVKALRLPASQHQGHERFACSNHANGACSGQQQHCTRFARYMQCIRASMLRMHMGPAPSSRPSDRGPLNWRFRMTVDRIIRASAMAASAMATQHARTAAFQAHVSAVWASIIWCLACVSAADCCSHTKCCCRGLQPSPQHVDKLCLLYCACSQSLHGPQAPAMLVGSKLQLGTKQDVCLTRHQYPAQRYTARIRMPKRTACNKTETGDPVTARPRWCSGSPLD